MTGFTKYFYADLSACDPGKLCFAIRRQDESKQHGKLKPLLRCGMAEKVDYAHNVRLSILLFRIYFDTLINLHGDIIKTDTPAFEITSIALLFKNKLIRPRTVLLI
ncbi:hypothetical protein ACP3P6_02205 [Enterobacter mori]